MLTRRGLLKKSSLSILLGLWADLSVPWKWVAKSWAQAREVLPKGFPTSKLAGMNPAEIDTRNLDIDPLEQFGTMGPTDLAVDVAAYRLKVTGEVNRPLSLNYDEILKRPTVTEDVLLICPGFFANHGRWTGIRLKDLIDEAQPKKEAVFVDVKGYEKEMRIPLESIYRKSIFLAYRINGVPLPRKHGFPIRLVYADVYGADWVKYVNEIVVVPMPKPQQ
jgi:sulfoxide reductase catalytic subunit YedY